MGRRVRFKPTMRQQMQASGRALAVMALAAPVEKAAAADAFVATVVAAIPPAPKKRAVRAERTAPNGGEAQVITEVGRMLKDHKDVLIMLRFNSGSVQRQTTDGDFVTMWFHRWIKRPEQMRLVDYFGLLAYKHTCGWWTKPIAIECKEPMWTLPRNLELKSYTREKEQKAFLDMIVRNGGIGIFATSADEVAEALK